MKAAIRSLARTIVMVCPVMLWTANTVKADGGSVSFQVSNTSLATTSGGTVTFDGTVTNDSGGDLHTSDFFFNFFGYDFTSVTPLQDLGVSTDFLIPNGATSVTVALFDVTLGMVPAGSNFPIEVVLQDVNNDLSATQTVTVSVPGIATPEPSAPLLCGIGLIAIAVWRIRNSSVASRDRGR
jgi:hypothetical protein